MGYYENQRAKVMMAIALQERGWEIYGWKDDESDMMTDYYSPANWEGIATKNGYVLVVDNSDGHNSGREIRKYTTADQVQAADNKKTYDKIMMLRRLTVANNASPAEEQTAKEKIALMEKKLADGQEKTSKLTVVGVYPEFQPNPKMMKWHIEKDGDILDKGNRLSCYGELKYFRADEPYYEPDRDDFSDEKSWKRSCEYHKNEYDRKLKLQKQFDQLIKRIDACAGGTLGEGEVTKYKTVKEYKQETYKEAVPLNIITYKAGDNFMLNRGFTYGAAKGYVYRIEEANSKMVRASRWDKKLNKILTGMSDPANRFWVPAASFDKYLDLGTISMVEIQEKQRTVTRDRLVKA